MYNGLEIFLSLGKVTGFDINPDGRMGRRYIGI
jgi:hypothetical protein